MCRINPAALADARAWLEFQQDRDRVHTVSGRRAGSVLRIHEALKRRVVLSLPAACLETGLAFQTAASAMNVLAAQGVAREITGRHRNRVFVYSQYLAILGEDTEILS